MPRRKGEETTSQRELLDTGEGRQLNVVIPADLHKKLKVRSILDEASMSKIVADALAEYLADD